MQRTCNPAQSLKQDWLSRNRGRTGGNKWTSRLTLRIDLLTTLDRGQRESLNQHFQFPIPNSQFPISNFQFPVLCFLTALDCRENPRIHVRISDDLYGCSYLAVFSYVGAVWRQIIPAPTWSLLRFITKANHTACYPVVLRRESCSNAAEKG